MNYSHLFSVAPMMDWTDRHCRYFHRLLTKKSVLYTEMITAGAILNGDRDYLLDFNKCENPLVLQIGGSDPDKCAKAALIAQDYGYDEINLNVGCPSDRVKSGRFGACLMKEADLVAKITEKMQESVSIPISIKCRLGIDDQIISDTLTEFIKKMNVEHLIIHARKAWLNGLSPKENRTVPPLEYDMVYKMKEMFPDKVISINGGIENLDEVKNHIKYVDGAMIGREAYHNPTILLDVDSKIYLEPKEAICLQDIISKMQDYIEDQMVKGQKFYNIAKHMLGIGYGRSGGKKWRRILSENGHKKDASPNLLQTAFEQSGLY